MEMKFETKRIEAQPILGIRATTTTDKLGEVMGPLFGEIYGYIQQSRQEPAGMPFAIYHWMDGHAIDPECEAEGHAVELECGMPVASPMDGGGRIEAGELPAGTVATVTHMGPYDALPKTWAALTEWMGSQGLQGAGAPWEVYVTDPGTEPDQSKWRTDIFFPVR